jgi:HK97 family phage prohead protease
VGDDALVSIRRGDVSDMSFQVIAIQVDRTQEAGEEVPTRTLREARLMDISPVTFPAYPTTDVAVRSLAAWRETQEPAPTPKLEERRRRIRLAEVDE